MSDTTDDMEAMAGQLESELEDYEEIMESDTLWRTKDGQVMKIKNMETSHIENCIRLLGRTVEAANHVYDWGEPEGDAAQDDFNSAVRHVENVAEMAANKIKAFKKELRHRGR